MNEQKPPDDEREYLEDGITPKYPRHYNMECEAVQFTANASPIKVVYPSYGTAFTDQQE